MTTPLHTPSDTVQEYTKDTYKDYDAVLAYMISLGIVNVRQPDPNLFKFNLNAEADTVYTFLVDKKEKNSMIAGMNTTTNQVICTHYIDHLSPLVKNTFASLKSGMKAAKALKKVSSVAYDPNNFIMNMLHAEKA